MLDVDDEELCLQIGRISHTEIIDDWNVIFYMRGREIYRNRLPNRCPGLRSADSFMYQDLAQCALQRRYHQPVAKSSVVDSAPGPACGLGKFEPITKEEIALHSRIRTIEVDEDAIIPEVEPLEEN